MAQKFILSKFKVDFMTLIRFFTTNPCKKSAGIIVIGDEILNGHVADTNSRFLLLKLHKLGVSVEKVSVVKDNINDVSQEVQIFSKNYSYVLTTGGIGPTHDDITFEAIAKAFNQQIIPHPDLVTMCSKFYKTTDLNHPGMKLAKIPESSKLIYSKDRKKFAYPCVSVANVYLFPGVPQLMEKLFKAIECEVFDGNRVFHTKSLYLKEREENIVKYLNIIVNKYPTVKVGSYPELYNEEYSVKVTLVSECNESVDKAFSEFLTMLPEEYIVKKE